MNGFLSLFATQPNRSVPYGDEATDVLYRRHRLRVMLAITLGYGFAYTCRISLAVVKKPLIDGGIFSAEELGIIGSALFYAYAFGKLINGFLADHANTKVFFAVGVAMSAALNLAMGGSTILWLSILLWGLNGWFQGFGAPASVVSLAHWFSNRERGRYYGIWSTAHSIGEGLTYFVVAALVSTLGWRWGYWGPGLLCLVVAVWMFRYLQDRPQTLGLPPVNDWKNDHWGPPVVSAQPPRSLSTQLSLLRIPAIWILAIASATMYVTRYGINSWGILYLQEEKGFTLIQAGSMLTVNTISGLIGCVAFGFMSDKFFKARRPPANLIFALIELAALWMIFYVPSDSVWFLSMAFFLYGIGLSGILTSLGGLFAVDIAPKRIAGAAMGFIGVFSYIGAALQERISGHLIGQGITMVDGVRVYDFDSVILFWVLSSVASLLLAATLWRVKLRD